MVVLLWKKALIRIPLVQSMFVTLSPCKKKENEVNAKRVADLATSPIYSMING